MSDWNKYKAHFSYTMEHKWYVFIECCKFGIPWRGLVHDLSKFTRKEFIPYALFFFDEDGKKRDTTSHYTTSNDDDFKLAWFWHQARNKHHWQFWITPNEAGQLVPMEIPHKYVWEMCADMIGASKAKRTGTALEWYSKNRLGMTLHPETRKLLEQILGYNRDTI